MTKTWITLCRILTMKNISSDDKRLGDNFKAIREYRELTQGKLAEMAEVGQQTIYKIENYIIRNPRNIKKYADILGVTVGFLYHGDPSQIPFLGVYSQNLIDINKPIGFIPVLNLEQVLLSPTNLEGISNELEKIPVYNEEELMLKAVKMDSLSMQSDTEVSIEKNAIVIFDPSERPTTNSIVVAHIDSEDRACIRQYINEGGTKILKPSNKAFATTPINEKCVILGVVKEKRVKF